MRIRKAIGAILIGVGGGTTSLYNGLHMEGS